MTRVFLSVALVLVCAACSPKVDLAQGLQVEPVASGWSDSGVVDGKVKIVPLASFKLKNVSNHTLPTLQVNAVFRRAGDTSEWGTAFVTVAGSSGLAPGLA